MSKVVTKDVGRRICEARKAAGVSAEELGRVIGKDRATIYRYESGFIERMPIDMLETIADYLHTTAAQLIGWENNPEHSVPVKIPVLGRVPAGVPISAVEEILDYEEITPDLARRGNFFALRVKGDSMEPRISDGDVVVVKQQDDCDTGDLAVILVNGEDATLKKVVKSDAGITLVPSNGKYDPITYTNKQIRSLPVRILGVVVELRAKFKEV